MKKLILFVSFFSIQSFSEDFCFSKISQYIDKETGEVLEGAFNGTLSGTGVNYAIALSYVRCSCITNVITDSVNDFLESSLSYDLINKEICLKNVKKWRGEVNYADGFYIKEVKTEGNQ